MNSAKIPVIKGKILNLSPGDFRKIKIKYSVVTPFENFQDKKVTDVNSDGSFNLQLDNPFPYQQIWLSVGDTLYTCLYANSDLFIEIDAEKVDKKKGVYLYGEGIKFLGTDGELTKLMNNHILFKRQQQLDIDREIQTLYNNRQLKLDELLLKYGNLYSRLLTIDNEFIKRNPSDYTWLIENERMSRYYSDLFSFFLNNKMDSALWEKVKKHKSYSVSNEGMSFYRGLLSYISIKSGKYRINDWSAIGQYSKIDKKGKEIIDSLTYYQKSSNMKSYYKLAPKAFALFSDTLAAISTMKTINFLDSTFIPAKADFLKIKIGSMNQNEQIIIYDIVLKNVRTDWCRNVILEETRKTSEKLNTISTILKESRPKTWASQSQSCLLVLNYIVSTILRHRNY
jgi:hypothetical protein